MNGSVALGKWEGHSSALDRRLCELTEEKHLAFWTVALLCYTTANFFWRKNDERTVATASNDQLCGGEAAPKPFAETDWPQPKLRVTAALPPLWSSAALCVYHTLQHSTGKALPHQQGANACPEFIQSLSTDIYTVRIKSHSHCKNKLPIYNSSNFDP